MSKHRMSSDYQRSVDGFVNREVRCNVSELIQYLRVHGDCGYEGELHNVCSWHDWREPALEYVNAMTRDECLEWLEGEDESGIVDRLRSDVRDSLMNGGDNHQEFCDRFNVEPHLIEAFEHWVVSDWLADKLEQNDEMVSKDIHGLTVWGRATTGQSISMDAVICDIYDAVNSG